jgi:hypothetical protein
MPDGWKPPPPTRFESSPTSSQLPPILASTELDDDEETDLKSPIIPTISTPTGSSSPRLRPRIEKPAITPLIGKPPQLDTKRPSLPVLQMNNHGPTTPGAMTTTGIEPEKEGSSWNWFSNKSKSKK